ncbi:arginine--tRNA ligase [Pseudohongiella sp. SYSU M77423]|uniref:arginine--tRNA ligase n=1 Tax=unclassified Pseudohongiella TaxID=2629611 RepID=UPI001F00E460|nr:MULTISPECIES: arginine--tRNA ligase [unclassified Pseudohongiella]MDH7943152.1 arginine--tRNA ligase [Pseudohongiella sp. SYSU M77423]MEC8860120.1 arginine--tRNA ligase [Pseudomonadota bacterium]
MQTLKETLDAAVTKALVKVTGITDARAQVIYASRPEFGDYQANGVMSVAKQLRRNPREVAQEVLAALDVAGLVSRAEVAGPGFINLFLDDSALNTRATAILQSKAPLILPDNTTQTIVVDYSSPNLAKEMHVGHLRGTIIGDTIVRVLEALGHCVIRQNHVGDWGTQFGMLIAHMTSLIEQGESVSGSLADLESFYRAAKQRFDDEPGFADLARSYVVRLQQGDAECLAAWQRFIEESLRHCQEVYDQLQVKLKPSDLCAESFYNNDLPKIVNELSARKLLTESDGAQCVFLEEFTGKDGTPLPVIIQKRDGGYLYATTDLAAVRYRSGQLGADRVLYVVDARQSLHFQQVFAVARAAGLVRSDCSLEHVAYGTMMGEDGKPFKTRSGDTVKLKALLDEAVQRAFALVSDKNPDLPEAQRREISDTVGVAAVKYAELSKNRTSDYIFDWSTMLSFDGNTAPYMLYAYARIQSVVRRLEAEGVKPGSQIQAIAAEERALLLKILQLSEAVRQVGQDCYANQLCQYLFELAGLFMKFYESCPILKSEPEIQASRLALASLTAQTLREGMNLLGIEPLQQM